MVWSDTLEELKNVGMMALGYIVANEYKRHGEMGKAMLNPLCVSLAITLKNAGADSIHIEEIIRRAQEAKGYE